MGDGADAYRSQGGATRPRYGQVAICWGADEQECRRIAREQFRWFGLGWPVMSELPGPASFDSATASVTEEQVASAIPCGPDAKAHLAAIRRFVEAGYTDVAVVQIGGDTQTDFIDFAHRELLPELRDGTG